SGSTSGGSRSQGGLNVHPQMLPPSLKSVLSKGIAPRGRSNPPAHRIATLWLTPAAAQRGHIQTRQARAVPLRIGTVSSIKNGTITLRLHLSGAMAKKLRTLRHVAITVRLALVAPGNQRVAIVAAGQY